MSQTSLSIAASRVRRELAVQPPPADAELGAVRGLVAVIDACLGRLNRAAGLPPGQAVLVRESALQASFPVLFYLRHHLSESAAAWLLGQWQRRAAAFGAAPETVTLALTAEAGGRPPEVGTAEQELLATFHLAVAERLRELAGQARGRAALRGLMTQLELSFDELGRLFRVSGETVRRWERGSHRIPASRLAAMDAAGAALDRLLEMFRAERLPAVVRRPAELFGGETALDWILRGRIAEVADRYDAALAYPS